MPFWPAHEGFDVVVCCEVFEHTPAWPQILATAHAALRPGGQLIATMAGPARAPHSGRRALPDDLEPGEHYANIELVPLADALEMAGFRDCEIELARDRQDLRVVARRPVPVHVVTAIYGGYDVEIQGMAPQVRAYGQTVDTVGSYTLVTDGTPFDADTQRYDPDRLYPETNVVAPCSADPRQAARWPKFLPHQALPEVVAPGDIVVWIDGRVEIVAEDFVDMVVGALGDAEYAAWQHPTQPTVAGQITACLREMPHKYDRADLIGHGAARVGAGETYDGMWQLTILAQRIDDTTTAVGTDVMAAGKTWPMSIDQIEFAYAVKRHGARAVYLPGGQGGFWANAGRTFRLHPHRDGT